MINNKPKVLLVRGCRGITDITGAERYLLTLLEAMDPSQCDYKLICITDPRTLDTPWLQELAKRQIDYVSIPIASLATLKDLFIIRRLAKETKANIIHTIDHRADLVGIGAAKSLGCASVVSFFGWTNFEKKSFRGRVYPWIDRRIQKHSDAIITDSASMVPLVNWGKKGPPVSVIHNGVNTERFHKDLYDQSMKNHFFGSGNFLLMAMIGRIHPVKGQLDFLRAAGKLFRNHPNCRFLIIGDAPVGYEDYLIELKQLVSDYQMEKVVKITNVHTSEIPKVFSAMDILIAPSYKESFSFTMIEGMSMELPIVASNVGGNPEMIKNGENGILIPPGDVAALEKAIESLLLSQKDRNLLGKKARQWVVDNCSTEIMAQKTLKVYKAILDKRQK